MNMDDDRLKRAFEKLNGYESQQEGVSWQTLVTRLDGTEGWSKTIISCILLVLISVAPVGVPLKGSRDEGLRPVPAFYQAGAQSIGNETEVGESFVPRDIDTSTLSIDEKSIVDVQFHQETETKRNDSYSEEASGSELESSYKNEVSEEGHDYLKVDFIKPTINSGMRRIASPRRPFRASFFVSGLYTFGVVEPIQNDNLKLRNYNSSVGYGFKAGLELPLITTGQGVIESGIQYMMLKKDFDYDFLIYDSETSTTNRSRTSLPINYLGLTMQYRRNNWAMGATYFDVLSRDSEVEINGRNMMMLHLLKEIPLPTSQNKLFVKTSMGFPLKGPFQVFRYNPIQLEVGLRIDRTLRR